MGLDFANAVKQGLNNNDKILAKKEDINNLKRQFSELEAENDWQWKTAIEGRIVSDNTRTTSRKKLASFKGEKTFKQGLTLKPEAYIKEKKLLEQGLNSDSIDFNIELSQPLYPWGVSKKEIEYNNLKLKLAEAKAELQELERNLLVNCLADYLELVELKLEGKIKLEEEGLARQLLKEEKNNSERKEILDAEIDLNEARQDVEEIKNKFQQACRELKQELGLDAKEELEVSITGDADLKWLADIEEELPNLDDEAKLLAQAKANSKQLLINKLEQEQVNQEHKEQELEQKPEIDLNANYDAADQQWDLALDVTHKLFNHDQDKLIREEIEEELRELKRESNQYLEELKTEVSDLVGQITVDELKVKEEKLRLERVILEVENIRGQQERNADCIEYQEGKLNLKKAELDLKKRQHQLLISKYELVKLLGGLKI